MLVDTSLLLRQERSEVDKIARCHSGDSGSLDSQGAIGRTNARLGNQQSHSTDVRRRLQNRTGIAVPGRPSIRESRVGYVLLADYSQQPDSALLPANRGGKACAHRGGGAV